MLPINLEVAIPIGEDIPWDKLSAELRKNLLDLEIHPGGGKITLVYYYMSGIETGTFNADVVELDARERRTTLQVYKYDETTICVTVVKQSRPDHLSAETFARGICSVIERLIRGYKAWERRSCTIRG